MAVPPTQRLMKPLEPVKVATPFRPKIDARISWHHAPGAVVLSNRTNPAQNPVHPPDARSGGRLWGTEDSLQVLCALEHTHYFQAQVGRAVKDEIVRQLSGCTSGGVCLVPAQGTGEPVALAPDLLPGVVLQRFGRSAVEKFLKELFERGVLPAVFALFEQAQRLADDLAAVLISPVRTLPSMNPLSSGVRWTAMVAFFTPSK